MVVLTGYPLTGGIRQALPSRFIGPFKVVRRINPVTYQLQLSRSLRINHTSHVSLLRPLLSSPLVPASIVPPAPRIIGGQPAFTLRRWLDSRRFCAEYSTWWTGMVTARRNVRGSQPGTSWIRPSSKSSFRDILIAKGTSGDAPKKGGPVMIWDIEAYKPQFFYFCQDHL